MNTREYVKRCLFSFLLSASLCGCVIIPQHKLPQYTAEQFPIAKQKIPFSYAVKSFSWSGENQRMTATVYQEINDVLQQSGDFNLVASNKNDDGYHCFLYFRNDVDESTLYQISQIFSSLTLGILPGYWQVNYSLVVEIKQGGELIKNYVYREQSSVWMQILLAPVTLIHSPNKTFQTVVDNMLRNFAHDFIVDQTSGIFAKKNNTVDLPAKPDDNHAMVYIIRPSTYNTRWAQVIHLDGKSDNTVMGYNNGMQYIYFPVGPGEHVILVHKNNSWIATSVEAAKGKMYFFRQDWVGPNGKQPHLTAIDAQEAMAHILLSQPGSMRTGGGGE
jgi:hypothetical protein